MRGAVGQPLATPGSFVPSLALTTTGVYVCYVVERSFGFFHDVQVGEGCDRLGVFPVAVRPGMNSPLSSESTTSPIA